MKPSDNEIEMLAAGFSIQHKNGLIRFAHALLEKYASARPSTVAGEATYYAVMHGNALYGVFDSEAAAEACKAKGPQDAPFSVKPLYTTPQASAEDVRNAALEEAAHLMEQTGKRIAASDIRALKTQADKDGGQQRNWVSDWSAAIKSLPMGRADPEGIRSPSNACMHRNECRAMLGRQQRAGDADLYGLAIECGAAISTDDLSWTFSYSAMRNFCIRASAALSAAQAEQGERDE